MNPDTASFISNDLKSTRWTGRLTMRGWWPGVATAKPDAAVAPSCEFDYDYYVCLAERRRSRGTALKRP